MTTSSREHLSVRFERSFVRHASGCWLWTKRISKNRYGLFAVGHQRRVYAHRWSYEHNRGEIPAGCDLDHLCRKRACVNPDHLEPVTRQDNLLRGDTIPARHAAKTHCPQGHEYNESNTYRYRGMRQCHTCRARVRLAWNSSRSRAAAALPVLFLEQ